MAPPAVDDAKQHKHYEQQFLLIYRIIIIIQLIFWIRTNFSIIPFIPSDFFLVAKDQV
jgi:hypothetical protein